MAQGEVKYRLTAENKDFREAFKQAQEHVLGLSTGFTEMNQAMELIGKAFDVLKGAAAAAMVPLEKALDLADRLSNLSAKTGITSEALQKLGAVGLTTGTSMEMLSVAITKMEKGLVETPGNFERMGLSAQALIAMKPEEAFAKIAEKINSIENPSQRAAAAIAAFGKSGAEMLPLLGTNIKAVSDRAVELGLVMSNQTVAALDAVGDQLDLTKAASGAVITNFGAMIGTAPGVGAAVRAVGDMFGILSAAILKNKDGIHSMTTALADGLVGAIRGSGTALIALASVAQTGLDVWASLRLTWISAEKGLYSLGIALNYAAKAADLMTTGGMSGMQATFSENIRLLNAAKTAADGEAQAVVKSNTDKSNSLATFRSALSEVSAQLLTVGKAQADDVASTGALTGSYKSAADAAKKRAEQLADLAAVDKEWAKQQKENAAAAKKEAAAEVANFRAVSAAFTTMQNTMTLANTTGVQRRLAQVKIAYQEQLRAIADLKIKNADELNALVLLANQSYDKAKKAAKGYYDSASEFAEANGFKTREELQLSADNAAEGYRQMKASGEFTYGELTKAHAAMIEAQDKLNDTHTLGTLEKFEIISNAASSILRSIFGKSKAAAIAAAIIDTIAAVVKTLAAYPWPWSLIPAAAVAVAGAIEISKIRSQDIGFALGTPSLGFVDFGAETQVALHGREAVVPEGRAAEFAAMHAVGGGPGSSGGPDTIVIPISISGEQFDRVILKRNRAGFIRLAPA